VIAQAQKEHFPYIVSNLSFGIGERGQARLPHLRGFATCVIVSSSKVILRVSSFQVRSARGQEGGLAPASRSLQLPNDQMKKFHTTNGKSRFLFF
jgi:hypothetical protein